MFGLYVEARIDQTGVGLLGCCLQRFYGQTKRYDEFELMLVNFVTNMSTLEASNCTYDRDGA